jgi:ABC-2 type transport system permease protein
MMFNPSLKNVYLFVPGLMAMLLMLVSTLMTSISITRKKEGGTMGLLLVSSLRPMQIIVG